MVLKLPLFLLSFTVLDTDEPRFSATHKGPGEREAEAEAMVTKSLAFRWKNGGRSNLFAPVILRFLGF